MPPALAYAPESEVDLLAAYRRATPPGSGCTGVNQHEGRAASFLRRWPDPQHWANEPLAGPAGAASADKRAVPDVLAARRASAAGL